MTAALQAPHLLTFIDDEDYRRRILAQLNRGGARHPLARAICYGNKGEIRQKYREGQEDQLSALGLVLNMVVLWNSVYTQACIKGIEAQGQKVDPFDIRRYAPLRHGHINFQGRCKISPNKLHPGTLRPSRTH